MEITAEQFLIVGGVIVLALFLLGIGIIGTLRGRNPDPALHQPVVSDKPAPNWMKTLAETATKTITRTPTASPALPPDALLVMRDPTSADWLVELNGMQYRNLNEIHDDRAASKILEALSGLQRFAGTIPLIKETPAQPVVAAASTPANRTATPSSPVVSAPTSAPASAPSQPTYPAPPNSIVDQIEKVLQRNLMQYPELTPRKIHVGVAPDGSLLIEIDRIFYPHADEVPDEQVRELIKTSIREWERTA